MNRKCDSCQHCFKETGTDPQIVGFCKYGPPSVVVWTDGAKIQFPPVSALMRCSRHKFIRFSWRWLATFDFVKFWK